jgi:hypothetical protein
MRVGGLNHDRTQGSVQVRTTRPPFSVFTYAVNRTGLLSHLRCLNARCWPPPRGPSSSVCAPTPFLRICIRHVTEPASSHGNLPANVPHNPRCLYAARQRYPSPSIPSPPSLLHSATNWDPDVLDVVSVTSSSNSTHHTQGQEMKETAHGAHPHTAAPAWNVQVRRCARTTAPNVLESVRRQQESLCWRQFGLEGIHTGGAECV